LTHEVVFRWAPPDVLQAADVDPIEHEAQLVGKITAQEAEINVKPAAILPMPD